ncbi:MAG: hypothetical protein KDC92_09375 [Bacteroidetes bacterium]|nr:hypothetical protein [Bacteroidota bacterium]
MEEKYTTYYLGAGASYNALPILNELSDKMMSLRSLLRQHGVSLSQSSMDLVESIYEFGSRAKEFGTIDTYARKLWLIEEFKELSKLKLCLSAFLTIWFEMDRVDSKSNPQPDVKQRIIKDINTSYQKIDLRYISLLATFLKKGPSLSDNVRFITWNYDLQIVSAFRYFMRNNPSLREVNEQISFLPSQETDLQICHSNGISGFYELKKGIGSFTERTNKSSLEEIIPAISFIWAEMQHDNISFNNLLTYAWENNEQSQIVRKRANEILEKTDILVIVGYSFPPFNRSIDKELLKDKPFTQVIYQDPSASWEFLNQTFGIKQQKIQIERQDMRQFVIPNSY